MKIYIVEQLYAMKRLLIRLLGGYTDADKDMEISNCLYYLLMCKHDKDDELYIALKERFNYYTNKLKDEED